MAYNGEAYGAFGFREQYPTVQWILHSLEDQNATMVIPWEVDQVSPIQFVSGTWFDPVTT